MLHKCKHTHENTGLWDCNFKDKNIFTVLLKVVRQQTIKMGCFIVCVSVSKGEREKMGL